MELDQLYKVLNEENDKERELHEKTRALILESNEIEVETKGGSYNFIDWDDMSSGSYSSGYIPFWGTTWAVMSDYNSIANNHCGATAATNISLYMIHL